MARITGIVSVFVKIRDLNFPLQLYNLSCVMQPFFSFSLAAVSPYVFRNEPGNFNPVFRRKSELLF